MIQVGQEFKFIIDDGRHYLVSERYPTTYDPEGNVNNFYDPMLIKRAKKDYGFHAIKSKNEHQMKVLF